MNAGAHWSGQRSPSSPPPVLPGQVEAPLRSRCSSSPSCRIGHRSGRGGPRGRHARSSARRRWRQRWRRGTRMRLLYPAPSPNPVAEVLEEALKLGMLAGDGLLAPPDALAVAAMSLSILSCAVVWAQISRGRRRRCRKVVGPAVDVHGGADDDLGKDLMYLPGVLVCP
uniref:Uncharacterized protein n=1 Tax=Triticum urartu TaxID=4572 RepID=A0A8R7V209_TRIUA